MRVFIFAGQCLLNSLFYSPPGVFVDLFPYDSQQPPHPSTCRPTPPPQAGLQSWLIHSNHGPDGLPFPPHSQLFPFPSQQYKSLCHPLVSATPSFSPASPPSHILPSPLRDSFPPVSPLSPSLSGLEVSHGNCTISYPHSKHPSSELPSQCPIDLAHSFHISGPLAPSRWSDLVDDGPF